MMEKTFGRMMILMIRDWDGFQAAMRKGLTACINKAGVAAHPKKTVLLLLAAILAVPGDGTAQDSKKRPDSIMEEVVVTGTRYAETVASVPANITVIDRRQIDNTTAYNVPELLRNEAGVQVNDIGGNRRNYRVDIRGFGETAQSNTLVLVDGRRINQADLSGTDWTLIPLDRVERVEVIRGGRGSVLYGDNAAGGVINIITREGGAAEAATSHRLEAAGGSYGTFKSSAATGGLTNDLAYDLTAGHFRTDGYRANSESEASDLGMNFGFYPSDTGKLNLRSGFHKDSTSLPGALKTSDFAAGLDRTATINPMDYADTEDVYFSGGPEIYFMTDNVFKLDISVRKRAVGQYASFAAGNFDSDTDIETVTLAPQFLIREDFFSLHNDIVLGFDYQNSAEDINNTSVFFGATTIGAFDLRKKNQGFYVHDKISLLKGLTGSGGFRHDRAEYIFSPSTPSHICMDEDLYTFDLNYSVSEALQFYGNFAKSYRYPVIDELYNFFTNTIDTTLTSQTADNYEAGVRYQFNERVYGTLNYFTVRTDNEIFYNAVTFANENMDGKTRRQGVELSAAAAFELFSLNFNYTYMEARIREGQFSGSFIPGIPRHKVSLGILFEPIAKLTIALNGTSVGERYFESDFANTYSRIAAYYPVNAKVKYSWQRYEFFLDMNNIFDEEYSEYGVLGGFPTEQAYYPSPETNFLAGVVVRW